MHELGLLRGVVAAVAKTAADYGASAVEAVDLTVGALSGAVPEALLGAWPLATAGTILAGASLRIEAIPAAVWCPACQAERVIDEYYALTCPVCGHPTGQLVSGREFDVTSADLTMPGDQPPQHGAAESDSASQASISSTARAAAAGSAAATADVSPT